ncbi:MAG: hypothetical protein L0191_19955 [Acidobacteria bacterium]|nr:hypothetical protein [Acidobacteriota bacterium]
MEERIELGWGGLDVEQGEISCWAHAGMTAQSEWRSRYRYTTADRESWRQEMGEEMACEYARTARSPQPCGNAPTPLLYGADGRVVRAE